MHYSAQQCSALWVKEFFRNIYSQGLNYCTHGHGRLEKKYNLDFELGKDKVGKGSLQESVESQKAYLICPLLYPAAVVLC